MTPPGARSRYGGYVPPPPSSNVVPQFPQGPPPIPAAVVAARRLQAQAAAAAKGGGGASSLPPPPAPPQLQQQYLTINGERIPDGADAATRARALAEAQLRARVSSMQAAAAQAVEIAESRAREVIVGSYGPLVTADALRALLDAALGAGFPDAAALGGAVVRVVFNAERRFSTIELRSSEMAAAAVTLSGQVDLLGSRIAIWRPGVRVDPVKATADAAAAAAALAKMLEGDLKGCREELKAVGVTLPALESPELGLAAAEEEEAAAAAEAAAEEQKKKEAAAAEAAAAAGAGAGNQNGGGDAKPRPPRQKPTPVLKVEGLLPAEALADAEALTHALTELAAECSKYGDVVRVETGELPEESPEGEGEGEGEEGKEGAAAAVPGAPIFVVFALAASAAVARLAVSGKSFGGRAVTGATFAKPEEVPEPAPEEEDEEEEGGGAA